MGDWLIKTQAAFGVAKPYAWYNRDAIVSGTRYTANYTMMESTTELCGNCHSNIRIGNEGPGWASATASSPISPHGFPAKDLFVGSLKESSTFFKFECTSCHFAKMTRDENGTTLPISQMVKGHSFKVNATILMNGTACSSCHITGSALGNLSTTIEKIQAETHDEWNATNITVQSALATIKAYGGEKSMSRTKIAQAYWNLRLVSSDESWGIHNPLKEKELLKDATILANDAVSSLGLATSNVDLVQGWNLVALNGTPSVTAPVSVLSSVSSNITVAWGYNATSSAWELYDPAMPTALNTLKTMVPGKGYWINAIKACKWAI
jgi:formate-dependent nitrite reductase cytochrome c552 subunit